MTKLNKTELRELLLSLRVCRFSDHGGLSWFGPGGDTLDKILTRAIDDPSATLSYLVPVRSLITALLDEDETLDNYD
jgi:hypothetical protein